MFVSQIFKFFFDMKFALNLLDECPTAAQKPPQAAEKEDEEMEDEENDSDEDEEDLFFRR